MEKIVEAKKLIATLHSLELTVPSYVQRLLSEGHGVYLSLDVVKSLIGELK